MTIRKFLDLSTVHLHPDDARELDRLVGTSEYTTILKGALGYMVWVGLMTSNGIPGRVQHALSLAQFDYEVDYVMFDADGTVHQNFPNYEKEWD